MAHPIRLAALFLTATVLSSICFGAETEPSNPAQTGILPVREGVMPPRGYARPPFHIKIKSAAISSTPTGLKPSQVRHAYGLDQLSNQGAGQTIAIIDAYDDPNIATDLSTFSSTFGLAPCTTQNGCFKKIYATGRQPASDSGWALEISLDVEWAHAIAPNAKIVLVEAASSGFSDLMRAVDVAVKNGATIVSMSFGGLEFSGETYYDSHFSVPGVTFVASSGDSGTGVEYPAASQYVLGVGGTTLSVDQYGNYLGEVAWSGSGGGLSAFEPETSGQISWPLPYAGKRGVPDVAYDADPNTGFPVYDSVSYNNQSGWFQVGGTSAGAPQWASMISIANSMRLALGKTNLHATYNQMYAVGKASYGDYNDVTSGSNGSCGTLCTASGGYDYVTGLGSSKANLVVPALVNLP